jgi:hypothetical protein
MPRIARGRRSEEWMLWLCSELYCLLNGRTHSVATGDIFTEHYIGNLTHLFVIPHISQTAEIFISFRNIPVKSTSN